MDMRIEAAAVTIKPRRDDFRGDTDDHPFVTPPSLRIARLANAGK